MPLLTIEGHGTFEIELGKRLVVAIEDSGFDNLHRCGGFARCTTCRVEFLAGEPDRMTEAELAKLEENGELGNFRLSCQCLVTHDMHVKPLLRFSEAVDMDDPGPPPEEEITPEPVWVDRPY